MSKANYIIDEETQTIILKLIETSESVNLGNMLFEDYTDRATFVLEEMVDFWQLVVNCKDVLDVYRIENSTIKYEYTEHHD